MNWQKIFRKIEFSLEAKCIYTTKAIASTFYMLECEANAAGIEEVVTEQLLPKEFGFFVYKDKENETQKIQKCISDTFAKLMQGLSKTTGKRVQWEGERGSTFKYESRQPSRQSSPTPVGKRFMWDGVKEHEESEEKTTRTGLDPSDHTTNQQYRKATPWGIEDGHKLN